MRSASPGFSRMVGRVVLIFCKQGVSRRVGDEGRVGPVKKDNSECGGPWTEDRRPRTVHRIRGSRTSSAVFGDSVAVLTFLPPLLTAIARIRLHHTLRLLSPPSAV